MRILVLDNYDSFTYNLVQYLREITGQPMDVCRNDAISLDAVGAYDLIVLSPGPGLPADAGIMPELIKRYAASKSIFGVCLGMQAIGEAFGSKLLNLEKVYHGLATKIKIVDNQEFMFEGVPDNFMAGRYHSWVIDPSTLPACLKVTATDQAGQLMAISHREYHLKAVQFHPESIMTEFGKQMLSNFLVESSSKIYSGAYYKAME